MKHFIPVPPSPEGRYVLLDGREDDLWLTTRSELRSKRGSWFLHAANVGTTATCHRPITAGLKRTALGTANKTAMRVPAAKLLGAVVSIHQQPRRCGYVGYRCLNKRLYSPLRQVRPSSAAPPESIAARLSGVSSRGP